MDIKTGVTLIAAFFAAFLFLDSRHANNESFNVKMAVAEERITKNENEFKKWDLNNEIRKLKKRIEEIERDWAGKIVPKSWLDQIKWLQDEILKKEKEKGELK